MTSAELEGVLHNLELPDGQVFPLPILLTQREKPPLAEGEIAGLAGERLLLVKEVYRLEPERIARAAFGTNSEAHPGVKKLYGQGDWAVAGVPLNSPDNRPTSPQVVRELAKQRGYRSMAAFQTRNPPHRGHEYLQRLALERFDGLLLHPVVGPKKDGDFDSETIRDSYRVLSGFYPPERVILSDLAISMRYAGPKEAVFHALIRKNYGASHFLVGRDHAGVGDFYSPYSAWETLNELAPRLGIEPVFIPEAFYCPLCGQIATERSCAHPAAQRESISMTKVRAMLAAGEAPPERWVRPQVAEVLRASAQRLG